MKKIIILTSDSLRHTYLRKALALNPKIEVLQSFCEKSSQHIYDFACDSLQVRHLQMREQSERDFFGAFVDFTPDLSKSEFIQKGEINTRLEQIIALNPDLIIAYGCAIIKPPLIQAFRDKIINIHLGLSPYYRGAGTNYFPFVNNELQYVGATFMYMNEGIDTGEIIHQIQAEVFLNDDIHSVGNRLISRLPKYLAQIILEYENLVKIPQPKDIKNGKLYKNKDFTKQSLVQIYENLKSGMIERVVCQNGEKDKIKLYENPLFVDLADLSKDR